jgi:hypothetical protein
MCQVVCTYGLEIITSARTYTWGLDLGHTKKEPSAKHDQEGPIPRWFLNLPRKWFLDVARLAHRRNVSEEALLQHLLEEGKREKSEDVMQEGRTEDTLYVQTLSRRIPMSTAHALLKEIGRYFGTLSVTNLSREELSARGKKAVAARWAKKRVEEQQKKKKPER